MKQELLFKFSAIMFFAAATVFFLTAFTSENSKAVYIALGAVFLVFGIGISAKSKK